MNSDRASSRHKQRIRVIPVTNRRLRQKFIRLPWSIYSKDLIWIPPLLIERQEHLSQRNPYFAHARAEFWLAYRNQTPVGRISAQIDRLHIERYRDSTGFFGMIEAEDDAEVFQALFTTAESWLRNQGMQQVRGPFNHSINEECGLLIDGFEFPPMVMMGHAPRYYGTRLEELGYRKAKDTLAYHIDAAFTPPPMMQLITERTAERITVRPLQRAYFKRDVSILQDIFNDAWSDNWGYIPFTDEEFSRLAQNLKYLVADNLVQIAEIDGVPAAMIVLFPNINEAIRDLNGQLFPFGWIKLLWRLKVAYPKTARIPLMGVRKRYQRSQLGIALAFMVINAVRDPAINRGIEKVELSWILEDNHGMRNILQSLGGTPYKQYRIYQKAL